jgi:hypothetical protein
MAIVFTNVACRSQYAPEIRNIFNLTVSSGQDSRFQRLINKPFPDDTVLTFSTVWAGQKLSLNTLPKLERLLDS